MLHLLHFFTYTVVLTFLHPVELSFWGHPSVARACAYAHVRVLKQSERMWNAGYTGASAMPTTSVAESNRCVTPPYALFSPAADCFIKEAKMQGYLSLSGKGGRYPALKIQGTSRVPVVPRSTIPFIYQVIYMYAKYPKRRGCDTQGTWHIDKYICFPFMEILYIPLWIYCLSANPTVLTKFKSIPLLIKKSPI